MNRLNAITSAHFAACALLLAGRAPARARQEARDTMGARPPKGAFVLFDGHGCDDWVQHGSGAPGAWTVENGELVVKNGTGDIETKRKFGDFRLHLEFNIPLMADKHGEARGNSGVYVHSLYEIQILDSYGVEPPTFVDCGAVYRRVAPRVNACRPPDTWQTFDITFHAPRFDAAGAVTAPPRVTVVQNGRTVQDDTAIEGPTGQRLAAHKPMTPTGPIELQDHHARLRFRNIWIVPLNG